MSSIETLRAEARAIAPQLEKAGEIAKRAADENRGMTADEKSVYDRAMRLAEPVLAQLKAHRTAGNFTAATSELSALGTAGSKAGQRLSFRGMGSQVASKILGSGMIGGVKTLSPSGVALVGQSFVGDPIPLGRPAQGLLELVPVRQQPSPSFAYLRQVSRDNQAAVVAENALKPVTEIGLERVESVLEVVAHLSSPAPRMWFEDVNALQTFVENEFRWGLNAAVEQLIIDTVNDTSGIQSQEFSSSIIETLRHSITLLEVAGHQAVAAVLHPADWASCELALASTSAIQNLGLPFEPATKRLFGCAIATTTAQTPGTAHVLGADAVVLDTDTQGVQLQWSENAGAETFARNQIVLRTEGRFACSVQAPLAVVLAELDTGS